MIQVKWRNLALFAASLVFALLLGRLNGVHPASTCIAYACGVLPCWFIVRMGWLP